jgi:TolA-binding protein
MMHKGADGTVLPFTKRFKEPGVAVQTQFTIAEAYFELAKKHRELKQDDLARREIAQGKKLLEEAIRDYPETEERAHADYLLANLAMEYAEELTDPEAKKQRYMEAITRFSDLVSSYSSSPYAPKSQFKKALAFDKLGQLDQACEEYVKLSYRYPDNELVAETIARLGQYFMTKGKEFQNNASAETDIVKKEKARLQMLDMFKSAARVFERLSVRFPDHTLAGKTTVLAAQCWIRAEELDKAIAVFGSVIDGKKGDSDLIAQSMYWSGDCYLKKLDYINAYRLLKRLTWDYPETTWAKYARGRLSEKELAAVEETEATK